MAYSNEFSFAPGPWLPIRDQEALDLLPDLDMATKQGKNFENPDFEMKVVVDANNYFATDMFYRLRCAAMKDEKFDAPFSNGSGAGVIFGATGGVMEAALRYAAEVILGKKLETVEFPEVRGVEGVKFAAYKLGDLEIKVAVASGTKNAKELLDKVKSGEVDVQFIEIMACPGGCVNGGGQPYQPASVRNSIDLRAVRAAVLYNADSAMDLRKSQDSSDVMKIYKEFLGAPNSHKAHEVLHTSYIKRGL